MSPAWWPAKTEQDRWNAIAFLGGDNYQMLLMARTILLVPTIE
jgi:hypothetical protein